MKRRVVTIAVAAGVVAGTVMMFSNHSSTQASEPAAQDIKPVAVAVVTREDLNRNIDLTAEFRPYQEIDLRAKVAGYLKFINVDIGDQVKQGELIGKIDTDELTDDLARTTADYRNAKLEYDRIAGVEKLRPHLLAQAEVDKAKATYDMAKANMERARTFMDYATISAPFDGVVTKRYADPGALIQAGTNSTTTQPIVHIAENKRLRLDFPVPESAVAEVNPGTPVAITVQSTGQSIEGKISRISGMVDNATRTMDAEVDIDNSSLQLKPGMYAHISVTLENKAGVLTLPVQALSTGDKPTVWRVNAKNQLEEVPVTLGLHTPEKVEISQGVEEGDRVLFGSRNAVSIGMTVEPKPVGPAKG